MLHSLQQKRRITQGAFFILFVLTPVFDIFRLDLNLGHFIIVGQDWTLGLEAFQRGQMTTGEAVFNIFTRVFLPLGLVARWSGDWLAQELGTTGIHFRESKRNQVLRMRQVVSVSEKH